MGSRAGPRRTTTAVASPRLRVGRALVLGVASLGVASLASASDPATTTDGTAVTYERRIEIGEREVAMRVLTDRTKPGAAELAAHYDLAAETDRVPALDVAVIVGLPAAIATQGAEPGLRATARKRLGAGNPLEALTLESEVYSPSFADDAGRWRAAIGATVRLGAKTRGTLDLAREQPLGSAARTSIAPAGTDAQLGFEHRIAPRTDVVLGAALGHKRDARSLRGTIGLVRRF